MIGISRNGWVLQLAQTNEDLMSIFDFYKSLPKGSLVGLDSETTGLDFIKNEIVGVCLSAFNSQGVQVGAYLPVRHSGYAHNLDKDTVFELCKYCIENHQTCLWNRAFDFGMLEREIGEIYWKNQSVSAQVAFYLGMTQPYPKLKDSYRLLFPRADVTIFNEVSESHNFGETNPELSYIYAASDPCMTVDVYRACFSRFPFIKNIFPLDNQAEEVLRSISKDYINFDTSLCSTMLEETTAKLSVLEKEIYALAGMPFLISSSQQTASVLSRFVPLTVKTEKGSISVKAEVLQKIDHPLAKLLVQHSDLRTFKNSYLTKYHNVSTASGGKLRVSWSGVAALTGRLACSGSDKNSYFSPKCNLQSVPKDVVISYVHPHPELGLCVNKVKEGSLGTVENKSGFRDCFVPPTGYDWLSADYSGQEFRIAINFAKEKILAEAINAGLDPHMETAALAFGVRDKKHRQMAKAVTFGLLYGQTVQGLAEKLGLPLERAQEIQTQYFKGLPSLERWIEFQHNLARRQGRVFTYFGRPINIDLSKNYGYGLRVSQNAPIQGTGADLIRYKLLTLLSWRDSGKLPSDAIKFIFSVYDEVNIAVKHEYVQFFVNALEQVMKQEQEDWLVPLTAQVSIGTNWGSLIDDPIMQNNRIVDSHAITWHSDDLKQQFHTYMGYSPVGVQL